MANSSPSSSSPDDGEAPFRSFTAAGRQSLKNLHFEFNKPKSFWSVLAKKAKSVLLVDDSSMPESEVAQNINYDKLQPQNTNTRPLLECEQRRGETPVLQRRLEALTSSLSSLGDTIGNAIEESFNKMEAKASDLISFKNLSGNAKANHLQDNAANSCHEHSKISSPLGHKDSFPRSFCQRQSCIEHVKHVNDSCQTLPANSLQHDVCVLRSSEQPHSKVKSLPKEDLVLKPLQLQQHSHESSADKETQLKASRDVSMAMAAKAKLLLRELKEAKADLAAAKERCAQLEEENRRICTSIDTGMKPDEEDLVRIQLERLLAEKARLAQENSYFARENQFLREMIEYHRLTMQNEGALLDESGSEATETASDCNCIVDELPPETIISTIIS